MEKVTQLGAAWFLVFTEYELVDEVKEDEGVDYVRRMGSWKIVHEILVEDTKPWDWQLGETEQ
jgi:hypothetical protein